MTSLITVRYCSTKIADLISSTSSRGLLCTARRLSSNNSYNIHFSYKVHQDFARSWLPNKTSSFHSTSFVLKRWNHTDRNLVLFDLADIGEGINEVVIREWYVKVGDKVKEFDAICEVQSDKASVTITSRYCGIVKEIFHNVDAVAKVGKPLVSILLEGSQQQSAPVVDSNTKELYSPNPSETQAAKTGDSKHIVSEETVTVQIIPTLPSVRRMAKEHGIDLREVTATGRDGRLLKDDLIRYLEGIENQQITLTHSKEKSLQNDKNDTQQISFNPITKAMFSKMTESLEIPQFSYSDDIDMTNLIIVLKSLRQSDIVSESQNDAKINPLSFMIKACSMALSDYPVINSSIGSDKRHIVQKNYHNIGIAMDTKHGLIVPNIKNVQRLNILQIAKELERLKILSASGKLSATDLSGSTFSFSNIGSIGGIYGIPVISSPELAIGAVGKIRKLPRYTSSNQIEARDIMQVVWSADHRVIDGATIARFSNLWKYYLENPSVMATRLC